MTNPHKLCLDKEWLYQKYIVEKLSTVKIAKIIGCQQETVSKWLKRHEIPIRSGSEAHSGELHWNYGNHWSEETKQKMSDANSGRTWKDVDPERAERYSQIFRGEGNPRYGVKLSEDQIERQRSSLIKWFKDPDNMLLHKQRIGCGPDHPHWRGGTSFEPYCYKFNEEFKNRVRSFFGYRCVLCGKTREENHGINLSVHHVNYDKQTCCNASVPMFAVLCNKCHSKTNHNREYYEALLCAIIMKVFNGKSYYTKEEYEALRKDTKI